MEASWFSASINFLLIILFIPLLNSSTNSFLSYPLPLTTHLNSCTNSSIIFSPCSSFLNSAAFTDFSSPLPNSFFRLIKKSSAVSYSNSPISNSSITFSFYISTVPLYTYDRIQWICVSTDSSLILILIYSLQAVIKSATLAIIPSKIWSFITSTSSLLSLSLGTASPPPTPPASRAWICAYMATNCSCCYLMTLCKFN